MHLTAAEAEAASLPCEHPSFMLQLRNETTQKMQSEEHKGCGKGLEGGIGKEFQGLSLLLPQVLREFCRSF